MNLRILTPTIHGLLDYMAAVGLIVFPFVLNLGTTAPLALWLSVIGGMALIAYSLMTDYTFGFAKVVPFKAHLALDLIAAVGFLAAPFVFGWSGLTAGYYFVMGVAVVLVVVLSAVDEAAVVPEGV